MAGMTESQKTRVVELRKKGWIHREIADELVLDESVVRRYLKKMGLSGRIFRSKERTSIPLGASPEHREIIRLRDEISRLTSEIEMSHREVLDDEKAAKFLGAVGRKKASPPTWTIKEKKGATTSEVPITTWSDWHGGERVSSAETNGLNEYNLSVMRTRVRRLVERTIRLADKHNGNYPGIVVNLLGDFISGGLHPELAKTDEVEAMRAVWECRDLIVWGFDKLVDRFGFIYAPCAAGNHGRATLKPEFKRYIYKNYDWMLYTILQKHYEKDKRIQFDIRPSNEVFYRVYNKKFLAMHGDMLGVKGGDGIIGAIGPIMRGEIKVRGSSAPISDYDILLLAHWHQPLWLPRVVVANSLKGYDEFVKNALRAPYTIPSQPLFFLHPHYGITSRWEIYLEKHVEAKPAEWVQVFNPAR
jgi:hypothetical protein